MFFFLGGGGGGLTPRQQPGSCSGEMMMMKYPFYWWRNLEHPEETTDLRQITDKLSNIRPVLMYKPYTAVKVCQLLAVGR